MFQFIIDLVPIPKPLGLSWHHGQKLCVAVGHLPVSSQCIAEGWPLCLSTSMLYRYPAAIARDTAHPMLFQEKSRWPTESSTAEA